MKEKMKSRRRVGLRTATTATTITLTDRRRDFFKSIYQRIQDLPENQLLPEEIQEEIKKYARSQNSEKAIQRLVEYPLSVVKQILSVLLQNLEGDLTPLITDLLKEIRLNDESLRYMTVDNKIKHQLDQYVKENLSAYLPTPSGTLTNVPLEQLQKDLASFFEKEEDGTVVGNVFEPLFHSFLKEEQIKTFLATCDFLTKDGQVSLRPFIAKLIDEHRFDLIHELFQSGFQPTSPQDWKDALPPAYYEKFPPLLWKLNEWKQFQPFVELSKNYSLDLNEFIKYSYYKDHKRLILMGQEIKEGEEEEDEPRKIPLRPSKHAPFFFLYNKSEIELLQRIRPWIDGLSCVLLLPKSHCDVYLGKPYGQYYFPTDMFYRDLANEEVQKTQVKTVFTMKHVSVENPSVMSVYHLLRNGQILPQTVSVYEKGIRYMEQHSQFRIPKIEEYFLSMPLENMSPTDQEILREKFQSDVSFLLSNTFHDRLDFDGMSSRILSSVLTRMKTEPLQTCLEHMFLLYFLFSPRYNLELLSPVVKERMNLFFYQLEHLDELPVQFYYPQFPFMGQEKQETFLRWQKRCCHHFVLENLYYLFTKNYPILHLKVDNYTVASSPPKTILLNVEMGNKLTLSHPFHEEYLYLPDVAGSILLHQEYLVKNEPLSFEVVSDMEKFLDLERVQAGLGSYMMDNDYEIFPTAPLPTRNMFHDEEPATALELLPDFKEKAYQFLESLSA